MSTKNQLASAAFQLFLLLVSGFASPTPTNAGGESQLLPLELYKENLREIFQLEFDNQKETLGFWIGISDPDYGDLYFVFGNGGAASSSGGDYEYIPATLDQRFDIGSISKTMGGTTIMRLAEDGFLNLKDTVQTLVPEFASKFPAYSKYTVEELLRMKTLVPDYMNDPDGVLGDYSQDISQRYSPEFIVSNALKKYPLPRPTYSSTNFVVLDLIAEAVTNRKIEDLVQQYVFDPLQLHNTILPNRYSSGTHPDPAATPYLGPRCVDEFSAYGYSGLTPYSDATDFSQGIVMTGTSGAVNSNIHDLLQWAKSGTGDSLLQSPEMVSRRHIYDSPLDSEGKDNYGMAQYQKLTPEYEGWVGHNGDAFGFGANAFHNEKLNASVATGQNTCHFLGMHDTVIRVIGEELKARRSNSGSSSSNNSARVSSSASTTSSASSSTMTSFRQVAMGLTLMVVAALL